MPAYGYALGDQAVNVFGSLPLREREKLLRVFDRIACRPNQLGDYQECGTSGRAYEIVLIGNLLVTWWADHAVKEVRIVRIERVD